MYNNYNEENEAIDLGVESHERSFGEATFEIWEDKGKGEWYTCILIKNV